MNIAQKTRARGWAVKRGEKTASNGVLGSPEAGLRGRRRKLKVIAFRSLSAALDAILARRKA